VGEVDGADAGGGDAVDVLGLQAAVGQGVQGRVGMQADHRHVGDPAHLGGLGRADDRNRFLLHRSYPFAGSKSGREMSSVCLAKLTWSGMSSCRASGVCGQPTMLVIICGPSASFTTAMA